MTKSNTKRFVGAAWSLLTFQTIASAGAVAVTGWAAFVVQRQLAQVQAAAPVEAAVPTEPSAQGPAPAEQAAGPGQTAEAGASRSEAAPAEPAPATTPAPVVPSCGIDDGIFLVSARVEWCDTGIVVRPGQRLTLRSQGEWSYSGTGFDARGNIGFRVPNAIVPRAPVGALIGRIGAAPPFLIGVERVFASTVGGPLHLSMNDVPGAFGDNAGDVYVLITLE